MPDGGEPVLLRPNESAQRAGDGARIEVQRAPVFAPAAASAATAAPRLNERGSAASVEATGAERVQPDVTTLMASVADRRVATVPVPESPVPGGSPGSQPQPQPPPQPQPQPQPQPLPQPEPTTPEVPAVPDVQPPPPPTPPIDIDPPDDHDHGDRDRGHGNDPGGHDPDNPGGGRGGGPRRTR